MTGPPRLGVSMTMGTAEGPGPLFGAPWIAKLCNGLARTADLLGGLGGERHHDPKWPMLELEKGMGSRLMGLVGLRGPLLLPVDPITRYVRELFREGALDETPWFPQVVPVQILRIGSLAILALPFEPSTVAGRRLRQALLEVLASEGVTDVVLNPYANAYAGYMTTFEEYQEQHYEAGYTVFGPWQLAAVRTAVSSLARDMLGGGSADLGGSPPRIRTEHIERQSYRKPWPAYGSPW